MKKKRRMSKGKRMIGTALGGKESTSTKRKGEEAEKKGKHSVVRIEISVPCCCGVHFLLLRE